MKSALAAIIMALTFTTASADDWMLDPYVIQPIEPIYPVIQAPRAQYYDYRANREPDLIDAYIAQLQREQMQRQRKAEMEQMERQRQQFIFEQKIFDRANNRDTCLPLEISKGKGWCSGRMMAQ